MRKLILVEFTATAAGVGLYTSHRLVAVTDDGGITEKGLQEKAVETFVPYFTEHYPASELIRAVAHATILE